MTLNVGTRFIDENHEEVRHSDPPTELLADTFVQLLDWVRWV